MAVPPPPPAPPPPPSAEFISPPPPPPQKQNSQLEHFHRTVFSTPPKQPTRPLLSCRVAAAAWRHVRAPRHRILLSRFQFGSLTDNDALYPAVARECARVLRREVGSSGLVRRGAHGLSLFTSSL